jgi:ADP-ribose pyrophosphatase
VSGFRWLHEDEVYAGRIWRVVMATFESPDGERFERDLVRSPGAVGVVPVVEGADGSCDVLLVRQYRPTIEAEMLEIPAGMRDVEGEAPEHTAARELAEEVGQRADQFELLTVVHPSAGMSDATTHVYLATGLHHVGIERHGPEEQHMTIVQVPLTDAVAMVESGAITDGKTVAGLLLADRRLGGSRSWSGRSSPAPNTA